MKLDKRVNLSQSTRLGLHRSRHFLWWIGIGLIPILLTGSTPPFDSLFVRASNKKIKVHSQPPTFLPTINNNAISMSQSHTYNYYTQVLVKMSFFPVINLLANILLSHNIKRVNLSGVKTFLARFKWNADFDILSIA